MRSLNLAAALRLQLFLFALLLAPLGCWAAGTGYIIDIDGPIGPAVSDHVIKSLETAKDADAPLVVLRIDTPGGLDASMRDIIKAILNSPVPVAGYVSPPGARAASAGTYILYATHVAAMAPATNLGAATPIPIGGPKLPKLPSQEPEKDPSEDSADENAKDADQPAAKPVNPVDAAQAKALNDAIAYIRGLAEQRGRNADWAEKAVREGASLSSSAALEANVIDLIVGDLDELLEKIDGRVVSVNGVDVTLDTKNLLLEVIEPDWRTRLLETITNPTVAYLLLMIGIYGLILEGYNPGGFVPGVVGAICLLIGLFALQLLPVNYTGLMLIILGIVLMIAEALVPSFGVLGFGGIAGFVVGSIMLMDTDVPGYQVPMALVGGIATAGSLAMLLTMYLLLRSRRQTVVTGAEALMGAHAEALGDFSHEGTVHLLGENWSATTDRPVQAGQQVEVVAREGLVLRVRPIEDSEQGAGEI